MSTKNKPLVPKYAKIWEFPSGYENFYHTTEGDNYSAVTKRIKPKTDEFPVERIINLENLRVELMNIIEGIGIEELLNLDKDFSANNKSLCNEFGLLEVGKIMDYSEFEEFYTRHDFMDQSFGIASLDVREIWKKDQKKNLSNYSENSDSWIWLLREIHYIEQVSGRKDISEEQLEDLMKKYTPMIQGMLNIDLKEISPRIKWVDGSLYFISESLKGNILLHYLDNLHTRIIRCFGCGKYIPAKRSTKKFCVKSGSCQKKYNEIRRQAKNKGLEFFTINRVTFNTLSGEPLKLLN